MANDYTEKSIVVLEQLEGVRKRPAMYVGDTGESGLHHLVWEIVDNSVTYHTPILYKCNGVIRHGPLGGLVDEQGPSRIPDSRGFVPKDEIFAPSYTRDGVLEWRKVTKLYRHATKHRILRVRLQNGVSVEITDCHSVFKWDNGLVPVEGRSLVVGDEIVVPSSLILPDSQSDTYIDMLRVLAGTGAMIALNKDVVRGIVAAHRTEIKKWCKDNHNDEDYYSSFYRFDYLPVSLVDDLGIFDEVPEDVYVGFKAKKVKRFVSVNESFVKVLGLYIAEGCVRHYPNGEVLDAVLSFGSHESDLIAHAQLLCYEVFGRHCSRRPAHDSAVNLFLGKEAVFLMKWLGCGGDCYSKRIPSIIWGLNDSLREVFLRSSHAGDGCPVSLFTDACCVKKELPKHVKFTYSSASSSLIDDMALLLLSLKRSFSVSKSHRSIEWYDQNGSSYRYRIGGKRTWCDVGTLRIKSVEKVEEKHPFVYDMSVEGNENFVGGSGCLVLHNSIDEAVAGHCDRIGVKFLKDGSVAVMDNGRGIPVKKHPTKDVPTVDVVMTVLHAGGKFDKKSYTTSGGLHGVGASVVNALSEWMVVKVRRHGKVWTRKYKRGVPTRKELDKTPAKNEGTGTCISFKPDGTIFKGCAFSKSRVVRRLKELSFLNPGLKIVLDWQGSKETFISKKGPVDYIEHQLGQREPLHPPIHFKTDNVADCQLEVAFAYYDGYDPIVSSFANNICTVEGGVHLNAALDSLSKAVMQSAEKYNMTKELGDLQVGKADVSEGIALVVSVRVPEPEFQGQTKTRLSNPNFRGPFGDWIQEQLVDLFAKKKTLAKIIAGKVVASLKARDAARRARELSRKKSSLESSALPGKLFDCTSKVPEECELYVVEGNSAGGTAVQARTRSFQAVLPLRGKVINVLKQPKVKCLRNAEVATLFQALGTKPDGSDVDLSGLRYHKVVISADADPDGGHIMCLLMTLFHEYMPSLIDRGHLYVAAAPLFRAVSKGGQSVYLKDDRDLERFRDENDMSRFTVKRFKGLGEMNADELKETVMDPQRRQLRKVYVEDSVEAKRVVECLMGKAIVERKQFLFDGLRFTNGGDGE